MFLAFFALNRINNLRIVSVAFRSIPADPTSSLEFRVFTVVFTSIPIVESCPDWPISCAVNTEARAIYSRTGVRNVSGGLEPHYEQTLDKREKFTGAPPPLFQNQIPLKNTKAIDVVPST